MAIPKPQTCLIFIPLAKNNDSFRYLQCKTHKSQLLVIWFQVNIVPLLIPKLIFCRDIYKIACNMLGIDFSILTSSSQSTAERVSCEKITCNTVACTKLWRNPWKHDWVHIWNFVPLCYGSGEKSWRIQAFPIMSNVLLQLYHKLPSTWTILKCTNVCESNIWLVKCSWKAIIRDLLELQPLFPLNSIWVLPGEGM